MPTQIGTPELRVAPEVVSGPRLHRSRVWRCSIPAVALAIALLLPFIHKAYTIDDPIFLTGAQQVLRDPLHPSNFSMAWNTDYPQRASEFVANGAAMYYLLAPVAAAGAKEWQAHLWMLFIFCCGLYATVSVALRLGFTDREAAWSGVLVASTPAVLAMASTSMPDIPAMAFGTLAVDRMLAWKQNRNLVNAALMVGLLTLAALTRSHMLLLAAACLIWLYEPGDRRRSIKQIWPLLFMPMLMWLFQGVTRDPSVKDGGVLAATLYFVSSEGVVRNTLSFFTHFALLLPFTLPWLVVTKRRGLSLALFAISVVVTAVLHNSVPLVLPLAVLSATLIISELLWQAWLRRDRLQLFLAAWMLLAFPVIVYFHLPAKYLVPSAAPVAFLLMIKLRVVSRPMRNAALTGTLALSLAMGLAIVRTDAKLAGLWRQAVAELIAPRIASGERVWFTGTWGFYWYAEQTGARQLMSVPPFPRPEDIIVSCSSGPHDFGLKVGGRARKIAYIEDAMPGGRIFEGKPRTGFYSNQWGYWPWVWGHDKITSFTVWRVNSPPREGLQSSNWGWPQR